MSDTAHAFVAELEKETPATRRVLERIPEDRLSWKPHAKSMSLAQLAQHVAAIPGAIARLSQQDGIDMSARGFDHVPGETKAAILATFEQSLATAKQVLGGLDDQAARATWTMKFGDREIFAIPRRDMLRMMLFNHWYHHRGELVVYLRLLDIPVPVVYGRSADENPFAAVAG